MKIRLRDILAQILTPWMADRPGLTVMYRLLWSLVSPLDWLLQTAYEGVQAAWPGVGTSTALPYIGRSRGITRGQLEADASYATRLRSWLDDWARAGSAEAVAFQIHTFLSSRPAVDVITRSGVRVRCSTTGVLTKDTVTWNWDGTSNPERVGYWSELFIVVYTTQFTAAPVWGASRTWGSGIGLGDTNTSSEYDTVASLLAQWKAAHTFVRCLLVNTNGALPVPNGNWGMWTTPGTGTNVPSSRDVTNNFFWDFLS